jgi:hypothetical protein
MSAPFTIRPATSGDLEGIWEIRYVNDVAGESDLPERGLVPPYLAHVLATGNLLVAESAAGIVGYAGTVTRGQVWYLTDLFIDPAAQSGSVGQSLLRALAPESGTRITLASVDPRAIALYTRFGMAPRWPDLLLEVAVERLQPFESVEVEFEEIAADNPELVQLDADASGRPRAIDLAFFVREERGQALRFHRDGATLGSGVVRFGAGRLWHPEAVTIGPISAVSAEAARDCVLAAVAHAAARGSYLEIAVPGSHPALRPLLEAGFRIVYVETYCGAEAGQIDPTRYVGSGGDLF